ncbi:DUF418 domain-containing protein [bacterium]|nr:DUF418 domain-containing protein [bacterium]
MNSPSNRIVAVDLLRGFALLGILIMNISSFALPTGSYYNPLAYEPTTLNRVVHGASHVLADQKMMAIFSMLFGASMILLMQKTEAAGRKFGGLHFARTGWLLLFGILHFVFLWEGDILALYALCGFILFLFRRLPAWAGISFGILVFLAPILWAPSLQSSFEELDEVNVVGVGRWWAPPLEVIEEDIAIYRGNYIGQIAHRFDEPSESKEDGEVSEWPAATLAIEAFCRALGMMLAGMGLYRAGVLRGQRSASFYRRTLAISLPLGLLISSYGLWKYYQYDYAFPRSLSLGRAPNHIATVFLAGAYVSMIMLWSKSSRLMNLKARLSYLGRMAFSNYIGQTVLATLVFYGWGLGLYGRLNRFELVGVILIIWAAQLLISPWWLKRFHYGPLEWLWRTMSYWKWQPMRR